MLKAPNLTRKWRDQKIRPLIPHPAYAGVTVVPLSCGRGRFKGALIDDADAEIVAAFQWRAKRDARHGVVRYYAERLERRTKMIPAILMHRLILGLAEGELADHADGNGLDNRRSNIRRADHAQNMANAGLRRSSRNRFKGVRRPRRGWGWHARIQARGVTYIDGPYDTEEDAARAYDRLALTHHGEFARLNFPEFAK